jgi:hypothetical protein
MLFSFSDEEESESKSSSDNTHDAKIVAHLRGNNGLRLSALTLSFF